MSSVRSSRVVYVALAVVLGCTESAGSKSANGHAIRDFAGHGRRPLAGHPEHELW
jgi:hypothetical protein